VTEFLSLTPFDSRKPLSDQVYGRIREAIVSLELEPGQMIYENELAASLGVSRTPVREAIRSLMNEELLEVLPQRGTRVAYISERKVLEAQAVRLLLELGAFRIAARNWNAADRAVTRAMLDRLLQDQRKAADTGDISGFMRLDEEFHRTILGIAGNATLLGVVYFMRGHLNRFRYLAIREYRHMHRVVEEHERLYEAIREGDEENAARHLEAHLGSIKREVPELRRAYPDYFID